MTECSCLLLFAFCNFHFPLVFWVGGNIQARCFILTLFKVEVSVAVLMSTSLATEISFNSA